MLLAAQTPAVPIGAASAKPSSPSRVVSEADVRGTMIASVPPPVRFGSLALTRPGEYVEYEIRRAGVKPGKVRVAYVLDKTEGPQTLRQVELDFVDSNPRHLVVLWFVIEKAPLLARMALWIPPQPPISVPMDVALNSLEVRGMAKSMGATRIDRGPFSGDAQRLAVTTSAGKVAQVVASEKVPLFGVESVEFGGDRWVATGSGDGAVSMLHAVPLKVPRLPPAPPPP